MTQREGTDSIRVYLTSAVSAALHSLRSRLFIEHSVKPSAEYGQRLSNSSVKKHEVMRENSPDMFIFANEITELGVLLHMPCMAQAGGTKLWEYLWRKSFSLLSTRLV